MSRFVIVEVDGKPMRILVGEPRRAGPRLGVQHTFHRFDETGHGYMFRESENYRAVASEASWRETFAFLARATARGRG